MRVIWSPVSSDYGQLGPNMAIPTLKFDHPIIVTLNITDLVPISHYFQSHYIEKWLEFMVDQ